METIELASYPPPLIDWLLVCAMWFTGGVMGYLSVSHAPPSIGHCLLMTRLLAASWLAFAGRLTFLLMDVGGLDFDWWATGALFLIGLFSLGVVAERLRLDDFADSEYLRSVPHDARDSRQ